MARRTKWHHRQPPWPFLILLLCCFLIVENPPLRVGFATSASDLKRAEFYPFSSFPMYSDFSPTPNYVYVTRPDGEALGCVSDLEVLSSVLKKAYDKELREIKAETGVPLGEMSIAQKRPAGDATLKLLHEEISPQVFKGGKFPALQLHEVVIQRGEEGIESEDFIVGNVTF